MEKYTFYENIRVFYVEAESFPEGILAAHKKLHLLLSDEDADANGRRFFGISYLDGKGSIVYKAAAEEIYPGETEKYGCETFTIKKGEFIAETLIDWCKEEKLVEKTFKKLLAYPRIDVNGYCLELYLNDKDMICMVPLDSKNVYNENLTLN